MFKHLQGAKALILDMEIFWKQNFEKCTYLAFLFAMALVAKKCTFNP